MAVPYRSTVELVRSKIDECLSAMKSFEKASLQLWDDISWLRGARDVLMQARQCALQSETAAFVVLDYVPGGDLFIRLLAFLHERGIVHRDLKPESILVLVDMCDWTSSVSLRRICRRIPRLPRRFVERRNASPLRHTAGEGLHAILSVLHSAILSREHT
jgi:hypothetical protein